MDTDSLNILIVDDEPSIRRTLETCLTVDGNRTFVASNADEAMEASRAHPIDLAFVDLRLGTSNGLDLISTLASESPRSKIVVITAFATIETAVEAMRRGAADYLPKPFVPAQVRAIVSRIAGVVAMESRLAELNEMVHAQGEIQLTSQTPAMRRAFDLAHQVAGSNATVLIRGESGTGKSVIAKLIHQWSPRANRPFKTVSTPALSADLLESELFGHLRGAFTGAVRDSPGRIAAAEGGTLFLDEIGDLPMPLQPKLLRFLQEREYERVGENRTRRADVRVVAATNVDLERATREGRFREDLFYRLNVVQIELPPLRERPDDIETQAQRMLAAIGGARFSGFTPAAVGFLRAQRWPGNLRELRNTVERATIVCTDKWIDVQHLSAGTPRADRSADTGERLSLDELEERHIRRILGTTTTLDEAANVLGIDVATLWRRRKKYGI